MINVRKATLQCTAECCFIEQSVRMGGCDADLVLLLELKLFSMESYRLR